MEGNRLDGVVLCDPGGKHSFTDSGLAMFDIKYL